MILYSIKKEKEMMPMGNVDRMTAALFLDIPISEVDRERFYMSLVGVKGFTDDKVVGRIIDTVIIYTDGSLALPQAQLSRYGFARLYYLKNGLYKDNIDDFVDSMSQFSDRMVAARELNTEYKARIKSHASLMQGYFYTNSKRLIRELNKFGMKAKVFDGKILVEFNNVQLAGTDSHMLYNKIYIYISDWEVSAFVLRFDNFDYSSRWGLGVSLHPNLDALNVPLMNAAGNYSVFAEALYHHVTSYLPFQGTLEDIADTYLRLRQLFAGLKYSFTSRDALSKEIFSRVEKEIKLKKIK